MSIAKYLAIAILAASAAIPLAARAGNFTTLYSFTGQSDGGNPSGPLTYQNGMLYGTTPGEYGGNKGNGNVYQVNAVTGQFNVVYTFNVSDGAGPVGGVIYEGGLLYGTTVGGGAGCQNQTCGTIFSLDPTSGTETVLYTAPANTWWRFSGPLNYLNGTLYGTTPYGGPNGNGSVFAFNLAADSFSTLYDFAGTTDGRWTNPELLYQNGIFYGSTEYGGKGCKGFGGCGVVFSIDPSTGSESVVHAFAAKGGKVPYSNLVYYGGSLIGETLIGGNPACGRGCGVSFAIKATNGHAKILETFTSRAESFSGQIIVGGNIYETIPLGGIGSGELLEVDLKTGQQTVLYTFTGGSGGADPVAPLTYYKGVFYGTTFQGGNRGCYQENGCGTVFKYVP